MYRCKGCHKTVDDDSMFCPFCGEFTMGQGDPVDTSPPAPPPDDNPYAARDASYAPPDDDNPYAVPTNAPPAMETTNRVSDAPPPEAGYSPPKPPPIGKVTRSDLPGQHYSSTNTRDYDPYAKQEPVFHDPTMMFSKNPVAFKPAGGSGYTAMSSFGVLGNFIVSLIPVLGLLIIIIWACGGCKLENRKTWARGYLLFLLLLGALFGGTFLVAQETADKLVSSVQNAITAVVSPTPEATATPAPTNPPKPSPSPKKKPKASPKPKS